MRTTMRYWKGSDGRLRRLVTHYFQSTKSYRLRVFPKEVNKNE